MIALEGRASLSLDPEVFRESFDREPFGFTHGLSELELFAFDSLRTLAEKYRGGDHFVAAGAPSPGAVFYSVSHSQCEPVEALERLDAGSYRVLLKRPRITIRGFAICSTRCFVRWSTCEVGSAVKRSFVFRVRS